jgi:hypothetical protein
LVREELYWAFPLECGRGGLKIVTKLEMVQQAVVVRGEATAEELTTFIEQCMA